MSTIRRVHARQILDSRGNPTLEAEVLLSNGFRGRAAVPSGASTGSREALELRDGDPKRYSGKGVSKAVRNVNEVIAPKLLGLDGAAQKAVDEMMIRLDGTPNKSKLGANAILGVSLAFAHAAALDAGQPLYAHLSRGRSTLLPLPQMNFVNGGAHADNTLDLQEIMIVPHGAASFSEALRMGAEIFRALNKVLHEKGLNTNVGDEGGYAPNVASNRDALELAMKGILAGGYHPGRDCSLAIDAAASEFYEDGKYFLESEDREFTNGELVDYYAELASSFPIVSLEDGMAESDWDGWEMLTKRLGDKMQIVGDDVFVTNPKIFAEGLRRKVANAILIKVNQIGTLTETQQTVELAAENGYGRVISHRSGETEDTTISHLAVAWETGQIKTGSLSRSDRVAKYNELLRIEEELGTKARFPGMGALVRGHPVASVPKKAATK